MNIAALIPHDYLPGLNTALIIVFGLYVLIRQRHWTGIRQYAELEQINGRISTVEGNLRRIDRDSNHWYRELTLNHEALIKEIRALASVDQHPDFRDQVQAVEDQLTRMEQELTSLPCYMQSILRKKEAEAE